MLGKVQREKRITTKNFSSNGASLSYISMGISVSTFFLILRAERMVRHT